MSAPEEPRPVTFEDRLTVAEIAGDALDHFPNDPKLYRLIDAVRCCGEFPECTHVLAWVEAHDARVSPGGGTPGQATDGGHGSAVSSGTAPHLHETEG